MKRRRKHARGGAQTPPIAADPSGPSADELAELSRKAAERDEYYDGLLRARADLENFRKRTLKDKEAWTALTVKSFALGLLDVLDNFERTLSAARAALGSDGASGTPLGNIVAGMGMVQQQFERALAGQKVLPIPARGLPFDPNLHEAVTQRDMVDVPAGQVVEELRRGYRIGELIVRPCQVVVARAPAEVQA